MCIDTTWLQNNLKYKLDAYMMSNTQYEQIRAAVLKLWWGWGLIIIPYIKYVYILYIWLVGWHKQKEIMFHYNLLNGFLQALTGMSAKWNGNIAVAQETGPVPTFLPYAEETVSFVFWPLLGIFQELPFCNSAEQNFFFSIKLNAERVQFYFLCSTCSCSRPCNNPV